jgi:serine O-acetyltransferase
MNIPILLWRLSRKLYKIKFSPMAKLVKAVNFFLFKTILPYEAEFESDIRLEHYAMGVVIHPNVRIGKRVIIYHGVTLATSSWIGSPHKIIIEDDVVIGAHVVVISRENETLTIGRGSKIGAGAIVTKSVAPGQVVISLPARPILKYQ